MMFDLEKAYNLKSKQLVRALAELSLANLRIEELEHKLSETGWKETRPMFDSYGQYIGESS